MIQPIIIPMNNVREVNCIIQEGVRYCEKKDLGKKEGGIIAFGVLGLVVWFVFWGWLSGERYDIGEGILIFIGGGICLPLLIWGLIAILS